MNASQFALCLHNSSQAYLGKTFPPALMKVLALEIKKKHLNNIRTPLFVVKKPLEVSELSGKAYKKI